MHFDFTDDQRMLRDALRAMLAGRCAPEVVRAAWSGDDQPSPVWAELADLGVLALRAPESVGGLDLDEIDLALLLEETGYAAVPDPVVEHVAVAIPALAALAPDSPWLAGALDGSTVVTVALRATHAHALDAGRADVLLLEDADHGLHAVPRDQVTLSPAPSVDGSRRPYDVGWQPTDATLLARDRDAIARALDRGALGAACQLLGVARRLIDEAVSYASVRRQFGKPIGSFQAVQHHLVDARLQLEMAAPTVHHAAWSVARGPADERALHVSMAKAAASRAATVAAKKSLQVHGAIGYTFEHDLHLWMKRAWALASAWGDAAWHRRRVASAVLG